MCLQGFRTVLLSSHRHTTHAPLLNSLPMWVPRPPISNLQRETCTVPSPLMQQQQNMLHFPSNFTIRRARSFVLRPSNSPLPSGRFSSLVHSALTAVVTSWESVSSTASQQTTILQGSLERQANLNPQPSMCSSPSILKGTENLVAELQVTLDLMPAVQVLFSLESSGLSEQMRLSSILLQQESQSNPVAAWPCPINNDRYHKAQMFTFWSQEHDTILRCSGNHAIWLTLSEWPTSEHRWRWAPLLSHMQMDPSLPEVASRLKSGDRLNDFTPSQWATHFDSSRSSLLSFAILQTFTILSLVLTQNLLRNYGLVKLASMAQALVPCDSIQLLATASYFAVQYTVTTAPDSEVARYSPFLDHCRAYTMWSGLGLDTPAKMVPLRMSQTISSRSPPLPTIRSFSLYFAMYTLLRWPDIILLGLLAFTSQTQIVLSGDPESRVFPSLENSTLHTPSLWPVIVLTSDPFSTSQSLMSLSWEAVANWVPRGLTATDSMLLTWARMDLWGSTSGTLNSSFCIRNCRQLESPAAHKTTVMTAGIICMHRNQTLIQYNMTKSSQSQAQIARLQKENEKLKSQIQTLTVLLQRYQDNMHHKCNIIRAAYQQNKELQEKLKKANGEKEGELYDCTIQIQNENNPEVIVRQRKDIVIQKLGLKVGFTGRQNSGKTFIANTLLDHSHEEGFSKHTKGISIIYPKPGSRIETVCYLDSEGIFKPRMSGEQSLIEDLVQQYLLFVCDIIVFTVSHAISAQQENIEAIAKKLAAGGQHKTLIVVHNYLNLGQVETVKQHFQRFIVDSFGLESQPFDSKQSVGNKYSYISKEVHKRLKVFHLILAKSDSAAGQFFNHTTFQFINSLFIQKTYHSEFNPTASMVQFLSHYYEKEVKPARKFESSVVKEDEDSRTYSIKNTALLKEEEEDQPVRAKSRVYFRQLNFKHQYIGDNEKPVLRVSFVYPFKATFFSAMYSEKQDLQNVEITVRVGHQGGETQFKYSLRLNSKEFRVAVPNRVFVPIRMHSEEAITAVKISNDKSRFKGPSEEEFQRKLTNFGCYYCDVDLIRLAD